MKKYIIHTLLLIVSLSSVNCSDFLEPDPRYAYTEMDAWKSIENTYLYVYGLYKPIYEYGPYGRKYAGVSMTDGFSDILRYNNSVMGTHGGDVNKLIYNGNISPSSNLLSDYTYEYARIRRINEFLYGLKTYVKYELKEQQQFEAQARFLRAYLYFMLARNHGSVVLRTELDGPAEAFKARSPETEVWDFIESDLDYAAKYLPEDWGPQRLGLLTKGAVNGFKSRAMLFAKRWSSAAEAAKAVVDYEGELYALVPNYSDVFKKDDTKEVVLGFRFHGEVKHAVTFDKLYCPPGDFPVGYDGVKSIAVPTQEIVDLYKMADGSSFDWTNPEHANNPFSNREPRFYASILYNGAPWKGRSIETFVGGVDGFKEYGAEAQPNTTTTGYYIRKLLDEDVSNMDIEGTKDWSEVRYAEVLLNQAEALNEMGESQKALIPLNKVRKRAELPDITETNQSNLRQIIRDERTIELAFEGQRYWDLRRWEIAHQVLDKQRMRGLKITKKSDQSLQYNVVDIDHNDRVFEERYYRFPIPLSEIMNNPLCTQIEKW